MTERKSYMITSDEIEKIEDIVYYLKHHNKNLTKMQDNFIYELEAIMYHMTDRYTGPADKNTDYLKEI